LPDTLRRTTLTDISAVAANRPWKIRRPLFPPGGFQHAKPNNEKNQVIILKKPGHEFGFDTVSLAEANV
jgi:hypothetical protein